MATIADYAPGEVSRLGEEIYQERIKSQVEKGNKGRVLVIDITTGNFEFRDDKRPLDSGQRLRERNPDAVLYGLRIGYPAVSKRGGWPVKR